MLDQAAILQKLGLSEKDSRIYLGLLTLGQASANAIARISGLKRPTTYVILEDLRKRGLVLKMPGAKKQMFSAKSPENLLDEKKRDLEDAERALPGLMSAYSSNTPHVRTIHFEGLSGMREALWYRIESLKEKEMVAFYGSSEDASPELVALFHSWNSALADQGTKVRSVVPDKKSLKEFREKDTAYGFIPKVLPPSVYTSQTSIDINDTFVRILMFKELQATIIENPKVAKAMREIFQMVWDPALLR